MIQRFRLFCAIALLSLPQTASAAIESNTVRYRDLVDPVHLGRVLNLDPGLVSRLHFRLRLVPISASDDPSQLSVAVAGQTYRANRVGAIDMPLTADLYQQNPIVTVRGPLSSGASIGMELRVRSASGPNIPLSVVNQAIEQYREATGRAAGPLRIFVPRLRTVVIRVDDRTARCTLREGTRSTPLAVPDRNGEMRFPIPKANSNASITCRPGAREILLESQS